MAEIHSRFPGYGFAVHKGYSTPQHVEALKRLGPCELHRRSFAPADSARRGRLVGARSAIYLRVQNQLAHFSWLHCQIVLR